MDLKKFNPFFECKQYRVPISQCPSFLFLIMGLIILATILTTYFISTLFIPDPLIVSLIVLFFAVLLFILAFFINQSFERLLKAHRIQSEFIKIISHSFFSPINQLSWTTELLEKRGALSSEYLKSVKEGVDKIRNLFFKIVLLSQIESDSLVLMNSKVSLEKLAKEALEKIKSTVKEKEINFHFSLKGNDFSVFADESKMKFVLENLLENAVQSIKEKGEIFLELEEKGDRVILRIKDTGIGIPKEEQKYLFQKFFRLESETKYQIPRLGLGLYLSRKIIEKSGGKIKFSSFEDKGSNFYFYLPKK
jgi:signal transduction histidine kinase